MKVLLKKEQKWLSNLWGIKFCRLLLAQFLIILLINNYSDVIMSSALEIIGSHRQGRPLLQINMTSLCSLETQKLDMIKCRLFVELLGDIVKFIFKLCLHRPLSVGEQFSGLFIYLFISDS